MFSKKNLPVSVLILVLLSPTDVFSQYNIRVDSIVVSAKTQCEKKYLIPFSDCASDIPLLKFADSLMHSKNQICTRAVINDQLGFCYSISYPDSFIYYQLIASGLFADAGNFARASYCLQNIAFKYEERNEISRALKYSNDALSIHTLRKDTASMANMYKYVGMLKSKLGWYNEGRQDITKAISLFNAKRNYLGVAVCNFDMALLELDLKKKDSSIFYIEKAKQLWLDQKGNTVRIFIWNNKLLEISLSTEDAVKSVNVYSQNLEILNSSDGGHIAPTILTEFYKNAYKVHHLCGDSANEKIFLDKYQKSIELH